LLFDWPGISAGTTLLAKAPCVSTFSPNFVSLAEGADGIRCPQRVDVNDSGVPHDILALSATELAVAFSDKPIHLEPVNYSRRPIRSEAAAED
jgi:hypothetical protein